MNNKRRNEFWKELNKPTDKINLMQFKDDIPKSIYRYRSVNEKSLSALLNDRLYFSTSNYYDDPFDTLFCIDKEKLKNEIYDILKDSNSENAFKQFQAYMGINIPFSIEYILNNRDILFDKINSLIDLLQKTFKSEIYSICFSESVLNQDLWLKYTSNYSGFVIEYETKYLLDNKLSIFNQNNQLMNKPISYLYPMIYSNKKFYANEYFKNVIYRIFNMDYMIKDLNRYLIDRRSVCLIKNKYHSNDKEWRMFCDGEPNYITLKPKSVTLGLKVSQSSKELLIDLCKNKNIDLYETCISDNYTLKRKKLRLN